VHLANLPMAVILSEAKDLLFLTSANH